MTAKPRAFTSDEVRDQFLDHMRLLVHDCASHPRATLKESLEGLMFSVLVMLDGESGGMPPYHVIPCASHIAKQNAIVDGENYYRPFELPEGTVDVHDGQMLHELFYKR